MIVLISSKIIIVIIINKSEILNNTKEKFSLWDWPESGR